LKKIKELLRVHHSFEENEDLLAYKFKMLNMILIVTAVFTFLFAVLSDLGINYIGPIHSKVDYAFSFSSIVLLILLRSSKVNYQLSAYGLLFIALIACTSALINVPQDEFRIIWFYLLVFAAYIITDIRGGIFITAASMVIIVTVNMFYELQLSDYAINSATLGLLFASLLFYSYTKKIDNYESSLFQKNRSLKRLASTDSLTGIMNRRCFEEMSQNYFLAARREQLPLSIMVIDLDYFKNINDNYGHKVGDEVLSDFTIVITKLLRGSDLFGRIGGEEFAILLFKTDNSGALKLAEKICTTIGQHRFPHNEKLTVSIGLGSLAEQEQTVQELFERADKALYQAKQQGRNQVYNAG